MLGLQSFASFLPFPSVHEITVVYILHAIFLGILGAGVAILMGVAMIGIGRAVDKAFGDNSITRILFAGCIIAVVCYFIPDLMFSGETTINAIIKNSAQIGIMMLLFMAILKIVLLALSFKSGYLGGPIFPTIFICTMIGLALGILFPDVPVGIFVLCLLAAAVTLALGTPLTAILLVVVVGATNQTMIVLFVISSAVALLIGITLKPFLEKMAAKNAEASP
jgi:H+/Cl- antiporter ClcA